MGVIVWSMVGVIFAFVISIITLVIVSEVRGVYIGLRGWDFV